MPRVPPREITRAARIHPLVGKLMGVCRSIPEAKRELRWLEDEILRIDEVDSFHLLQKYKVPFQPMPKTLTRRGKWERLLLHKMVEERAKGTPFAYVVGT